MKGVKFKESIIIQDNVASVFDFTQDYDSRLLWDTFLKKAELIENATEPKKGVKAYCVAKNGLGMITEYVSFNRPKVTAVKVTKGPYIFKSFLGSWTFKQLNEHVTEVTFLYSFEFRFPFNTVKRYLKYNLKKNVKLRLEGLKDYIENSNRSLVDETKLLMADGISGKQ